MIYYTPNKYWLKDISHLFRSWTMTRIVRAVGWIGLFTMIVALIEIELIGQNMFQPGLSIFSLLGIVLSILLVFRTSTAYERWWEGRMQWGALVNHSRNLAVAAAATFPEDDTESKHRMAVLITNFCIALKEHLRAGVKVEELVFLSEEDKQEYSLKGHIPGHISLQIHRVVEKMHREKKITQEDFLNTKPHTQALLDILGACERIKKTPIPFSYSVYMKIFITVYGLLLPFALIPELGYLAVPVVMVVFFAFIGVQLMAEEIEDPFGLDCNDLPTGDIAHNIKNNVFEILEAKSSIGKEHVLEEYEKVF